MLKFDPENLFPVLESNFSFDLAARDHSKKVDAFLGLDVESIEQLLRESKILCDRETWKHSDPQVFLTPYVELRFILELLKPRAFETIVDIGAAYCRMAFVIEKHFPDVLFRGYEFVSARVAEAQRLFVLNNFRRSKVECRDVNHVEFKLLPEEYYFIYDFGSRTEISSFLTRMQNLHGTGKSFTLIARGNRVRDCVEGEHRKWLHKSVQLPRNCEFAIYACTML